MKNKFIPQYMKTPYLDPLGHFFLQWISYKKNKQKFVEDHPMNIQNKFGSTWASTSGFRDED